jgi:plastocyanin
MNTTIVGHTVTIVRQGGHVIAEPKTLDGKKGDTLQIGSTEGTFRVVFVPWPFAEREEANGVENKDNKHKVLTFDKSGAFDFFCYLTPPGGTELKYAKRPDGHPDGGHGNVHP